MKDILIARSDPRLSGMSGERTWSWRELGIFGNDLSSFPCSGLPSARGDFLCWSLCCPSSPGTVPVLPWPLQLCCTSLQLGEWGFHTRGGSSCCSSSPFLTQESWHNLALRFSLNIRRPGECSKCSRVCLYLSQGDRHTLWPESNLILTTGPKYSLHILGCSPLWLSLKE